MVTLTPTEGSPRKVWKSILEYIIYYLVITISLLLFWFNLTWDFSQTTGEDANVFCLAGHAIRDGNNPYLSQDLGSNHSWNYLPIYAYGFRFLCTRMGFADNYIYLYAILILISLDYWLEGKSWLYGLALCLTGLFSFGWNLVSGNIGVVELLLISLAAILLKNRKNKSGFFLLGWMASIKIITLLYFYPFLLIIKDQKTRMTSFLWGIFGFLLPVVISLLTAFNLMPWYAKQLLGLIPGQHAAISERTDFTSPSMVNLLSDLFSVALPTWFSLLISLILVLLVILMIHKAVDFFNRHSPEMGNQWEQTIGMFLIPIALFLPQVKPYSFLPALLFIYLVTRNWSVWLRSLMLVFVSILPLTGYYLYKYDILPQDWMDQSGFLPGLVNFLLKYHQPLCLMGALGLILLHRAAEIKGHNPSSDSGQQHS